MGLYMERAYVINCAFPTCECSYHGARAVNEERVERRACSEGWITRHDMWFCPEHNGASSSKVTEKP
jgi:hypothetical protein